MIEYGFVQLQPTCSEESENKTLDLHLSLCIRLKYAISIISTLYKSMLKCTFSQWLGCLLLASLHTVYYKCLKNMCLPNQIDVVQPANKSMQVTE